MKGFIEVTNKTDSTIKYIVHYTAISFLKINNHIDSFFNNKWLRESYEEIKELIKNAQ